MLVPDIQGGWFTGTNNASATLNRPFWVQLTEYDGTTGYYGWQEMVNTDDGWIVVDGGRTGTTELWPAFSPSDSVMTIGEIVLIMRSYLSVDYDWVWIMVTACCGIGDIVTITEDYTAEYSQIIKVDTSSNPVTVTLPTPIDNGWISVKKDTPDGNIVIIITETGITINEQKTLTMTKKDEYMFFFSYENNWYTLEQFFYNPFMPVPKAATTVPLPTMIYDNGNGGAGATLTSSVNGAFSNTYSDDVTLNLGDLLLIKNQADPTQNGLYNIIQLGDAGSPFIFERSPFMDSANKFPGAKISVSQGTVNGGQSFTLSGPAPTVGTSDVGFYEQLSIKPPADAATVEPLPTSTYDNGDGTITGDANGAFPTIDGYTPSLGDTLLIKNQADPVENGLYDLIQVGDGSTPFILKRNPSMQFGSQFPGAYIPILNGNVNGRLTWKITNTTPPNIGTDDITQEIDGGLTTALGLGTIASSSTIDLGTLAGSVITVTGSTGPITSFGDLIDGTPPVKYLTFTGTPTLTDGANLVLPGNANIVVQAGDSLIASYDSGVWTVIDYLRAAAGSLSTLLAGTSANNVVQLDGSARLPAVDGSQLTNLPTPGGVPSTTILTSDVSITSTSMSNVTGFSFSVNANTNYVAEFHLYIDANSDPNGIDLQLTGPASPTGLLMIVIPSTYSPVFVTAFSTPSGSTGAVGGFYYVNVRVSLRNGANSGTVQLQAALASGSTTQYVKANSWMTSTEL